MIKYFLITLLLLCSCGSDNAKPINNKVKLPDSLFGSITNKSISVKEVKTAKVGEAVIVRGKIMGSRQPFVNNRASFILADPEILTSCDMRQDDACKTPWDNCCDGKDARKAGTLNVQILDETGSVYKTGLKNIKGLKELKYIIVEGNLDKSSSSDFTIINAKKIEVLTQTDSRIKSGNHEIKGAHNHKEEKGSHNH